MTPREEKILAKVYECMKLAHEGTMHYYVHKHCSKNSNIIVIEYDQERIIVLKHEFPVYRELMHCAYTPLRVSMIDRATGKAIGRELTFNNDYKDDSGVRNFIIAGSILVHSPTIQG